MLNIKVVCITKDYKSKATLIDNFSFIGMDVDIAKEVVTGYATEAPAGFDAVIIQLVSRLSLSRYELEVDYS